MSIMGHGVCVHVYCNSFVKIMSVWLRDTSLSLTTLRCSLRLRVRLCVYSTVDDWIPFGLPVAGAVAVLYRVGLGVSTSATGQHG